MFSLIRATPDPDSQTQTLRCTMIRSSSKLQDGRSIRRRRSIRQLLDRLIRGSSDPTESRRGQLLLESLEKRQMLAGDTDLLFTNGVDPPTTAVFPAETSNPLPVAGQSEGQAPNDLVQFAKDLTAAGVQFFGAAWCPDCTEQKQLFEDGGDNLPFVEVTNPDRTINSIGVAENITDFPTWKFPDGTVVSGLQSLQALSSLSGVAIPQSDQPTFEAIGNQTVLLGSPLHIPVDAYDPGGGPLTVTVSIDDPTLLEATVLSGNRSIRIDMEDWGDMVFELFEQRAPVPAGRVADLADAGFYDGIIFHRVVDDFVLQAGDPTGTGTSGSTLGPFDDQFNPDLQHNRSGVLSFAKTTDDTNNSQFFITEGPARSLDFQHSIFGQLVEGDDVREAISETEVNSASRPTTPVTISTIEVFTDIENSVVMLKAIGNASGTTNVTFTVTDQTGNTFSETIQVSVAADSENSQPFLNPITTPATTTVNTVAQLQLSSVDVEGDSVTYFAQLESNAVNGTVSVDPTTGLVSVTPATEFSGTIEVLVGVRRAQPNGFQVNDQDTQSVAFVFEGEQTIVTPTSVDLQTASDTGVSNIDNITNAGSLSFTVNDVTNGANVELVNTNSGSVVGVGLATGTSIVITTNNIAALGDGTYPIAARQRLGAIVSDLSPTMVLVYDTTAPDSVVSSAATSGNLGRLYQTDLISTEEGSGLVYALTTAPTGATIDAATGQIEWTPAQQDLGDNTFTLELTDAAGNTRSESFTIAVAGEPLAEVRLDLTDLQGNPITSIAVGEVFLLNLVGVDARLFNKPGIFSLYADVLFDSSLVRPEPGSSIEFSDDFTVERKGSFSSGLIDELGAVSNVLNATNDPENVIATVRMEAIASGTVNIRSEPADEFDSDILLFFEDNRIPADAVFYGSSTLAIGQSFIVGADTFTVAEDSGATTLDVLANDQIVSGSATLSVVSVTQPASGGTVSLSNGIVTLTPATDFTGTLEFSYRVGDSSGVQENGTVTVTVSSVNDAPTAVNDTFNIDQNSSGNTLDLLSNDLIAPDTGESLTITAVAATSNGGTVTISGDGQSVSYTPATGFTGSETFNYTISDGGLSDSAEVTVTVAPSDNPPTAVADAFTVTEDDPQASFAVLANDTRDVDNQTFSLSAVGTPSQGGSASISNDGSEILYQPAANFAGTEEVTYTIRDTGGGLAVATVTFTVTSVNDPPPVENLSRTLTRGSGESTVYAASDLPENPDAGETLTITTVSSPTTAGGTARIDSTSQTILYTPPSAEFTGQDTFTYTVADGSGETSTGTVTINVADFTQRDITFGMPSIATNSRIDGVVIRGTNLLGETVEVPLSFGDNDARFENLLPGDYTIEIPAIPFLQNATEPRQISVTSAADDGDLTIQSQIGRLRPEYISVRDWLGSARQRNLLVAVAPGQSSVLTVLSPSADTINDPTVTLNTAGDELTIRGTQAGQTTSVEAMLPTDSDRRVQLRGEVDGIRLYKISVESDVTFGPPAGEGEAPSSFVVGDIQAEGESLVAAATTQADLLVPVAKDGSTRSDATVLALPEGDLWIGSIGNDDDQNRIVDTQSSVDSAMQTVTVLSIDSTATDAIANDSPLDQKLVDEALKSGLDSTTNG